MLRQVVLVLAIASLGAFTSASSAQAQENGCFCTKQYDPVCGIDGQTYGNACEANCASVPIAYPGECRPVFTDPPNQQCPAGSALACPGCVEGTPPWQCQCRCVPINQPTPTPTPFPTPEPHCLWSCSSFSIGPDGSTQCESNCYPKHNWWQRFQNKRGGSWWNVNIWQQQSSPSRFMSFIRSWSSF